MYESWNKNRVVGSNEPTTLWDGISEFLKTS